jgi:hypothetical protein
MAKKRTPASSTADGPKGQRPSMPADYGIPVNDKGLLPWSHVNARVAGAKHYWICTIGPDGRPHATPVDGLWIEGRLYFGGSPKTRWNRNLAANPALSVHLESALDVVIMRGDALPLHEPAKELTKRLTQASIEKYGYGPNPEDYGKPGIFVFQPRVVLAWKEFPKDVTRWTLHA